MSDIDQGYSILLVHLRKPSSTLPLQALQTLLAHFLANTLTPTPLAATLISSQYFRPFSHLKLNAIVTALRHAVHAKFKLLEAESSVRVHARSAEWVRGVLRGMAGGHAVIRFAAAGGLLLGLEDVGAHVGLGAGSGGARRRTEEEVVLALAEIMEVYTATGWEKDFRQETEDEVPVLSLSLLFAAQFLPHVLPSRVKALPLQTLFAHLMSTLEHTFLSGAFVASSPALTQLTASPLFASVAATAKLTASTLSLLAEARPKEGWPAMYNALNRLQTLAAFVERDWTRSTFAPSFAADVWTVLKTLLFTTVMLIQSILSTIVYIRSPSHSITAAALAQQALQTLSHLAFVISKFGGVTGGAFAELKRAFYMALDVLAADAVAAEAYVFGLGHEQHGESSHSDVRAKSAFNLAAIEQLVPVLALPVLETIVLPLCLPHLDDPGHRETYESAHSVVLAIFAAHPSATANERAGATVSASVPTFVERLVPFYARCLLENSGEGKLSSAQLSLAHAALVRASEPVLASYCVDLLVEEIDRVLSASLSAPSSSRHVVLPSEEAGAHAQRLRLALMATLPSLPLTLLPRALAAMARVIDDTQSERDRGKLMGALYREIVERVGDREREYVVRWWVDWTDGKTLESGVRSQEEGIETVAKL
ncbi:hypothetical protein BV25DRAFT_1920897 [Artomyces pyxidatus]|uniref:Uncharacterized protein n=1 Tax=Artomyces pyxidatus TaxID=48021 RepID=A0ACB8SK00_9AGAM|nr:hypothetical protein BV25DRAFT_1920897 [Artomyces pyxidatus]